MDFLFSELSLISLAPKSSAFWMIIDVGQFTFVVIENFPFSSVLAVSTTPNVSTGNSVIYFLFDCIQTVASMTGSPDSLSIAIPLKVYSGGLSM